jgi:hypothetical protein
MDASAGTGYGRAAIDALQSPSAASESAAAATATQVDDAGPQPGADAVEC